jgi:hypothetical protein
VLPLVIFSECKIAAELSSVQIRIQFKKLMPQSELTILPGGVSHYTFLDTCTDAGKTKLAVYCAEETGVDRDKVHSTVSGMAVKFFDRTLR